MGDDSTPQRDNDGQVGGANREAARCRTRVKDEVALEKANASLGAMRRQYVEMIAAGVGFDFDGDGGRTAEFDGC